MLQFKSLLRALRLTFPKSLRITRKLIVFSTLTVMIVSTLLTLMNIMYVFNERNVNFQNEVKRTMQTINPTLNALVWNVDYKQVNILVRSVLTIRGIDRIVIRDIDGIEICNEISQFKSETGWLTWGAENYELELTINSLESPPSKIATARIHYNNFHIAQDLYSEIFNLIVLNFVKMGIIFIFLYYGFRKMIVNRIDKAILHLSKSAKMGLTENVGSLDLSYSPKAEIDELDDLASYINIYQENERLAFQMITKAKEEAVNASRLKSLFIASMSHELRSPINAILGFNNFLKQAPLSEEYLNYLNLQTKAAQHLRVLVDDILDLTKLEAGEMKLNYTPNSLTEVLEGAAGLMKQFAVDKGLKLETNLKDVQQIYAVLERDRLNQIIINLLSNAIKFTNEGTVKLSAKIDSGKIIISVKDTGVGIPVEDQKTIFEPFKQAESALKSRTKGTGIGLSVVRRLVDLMKGRLTLISTIGVGTEFIIKLPYEPCIESDLFKSKSDSTMQKNETPFALYDCRKILIVDDIPENLMILKLFLKPYDLEILTAENGKQATEVFRNHADLDLILMDLQMPELNGYDAIKIIRNEELSRSQKPVVALALTAFTSRNELDQALECGYNDCVLKPVELDSVLRTMQKFGLTFRSKPNASLPKKIA